MLPGLRPPAFCKVTYQAAFVRLRTGLLENYRTPRLARRGICNLSDTVAVVVVDWAAVVMGLAFHVAGNTGGNLDITKWVDPAGITEREGVVAGHRSRASLDITNSLRASRAGTHYRTLRFDR